MPTWMTLQIAFLSTILIVFFAAREDARLGHDDGAPVDRVYPRAYRRAFGWGASGAIQPSVRTKNAIKAVLDIRKYEIDLYWKRAAYFWTFIGLTYAGCGALAVDSSRTVTELDSGTPVANAVVASNLLWVVVCFGLFLSVAWHLVNKGSKFWQENWENHLDLLEDEYHGPLYKVVVSRPGRGAGEWTGRFVDMVNGPAPFSVSKVNAALSFFNILVWAGILLHLCLCRFHWFQISADQEIGMMLLGTLAAILLMINMSDTNQTHRRELSATRRYARIRR